MKSIRESIDLITHLFEMPFLFTTADDFGLGDPERNHREYVRLSGVPQETIFETETWKLAVSTRPGLGEIFLLRKDTEVLTFYVKYKKIHIPGLGMAVTQVVIWRRDNPRFPNITSYVFFDYLLERFETIVSDAFQTQDGQRFWINRMSEAVKRGLTVGLIDEGKIVPYDGSQSFDKWIETVGSHAWGDDSVHENRLFFITKRKLQLTEANLVPPSPGVAER